MGGGRNGFAGWGMRRVRSGGGGGGMLDFTYYFCLDVGEGNWNVDGNGG